tara:strand:+ start:288 stop:488 length:201 start_codon:yes stop_codon:yes gene_type:complete
MAERYFKKSKSKFNVGYSDVIVKYDSRKHDIKSFEDRFEECDVNGNAIKKEVKKPAKKKTAKKGSK